MSADLSNSTSGICRAYDNMRFCGAVEFVTRHMQFLWIWQIFFLLLIALCCDGLPVAMQRLKRSPVYDDVQNYLTTYGYLPETDSEAGNLRTEDQLQDAIRNLQAFGNIPVTGVLDDETIRLLRRPRCGLPDVESGDNVRKKRYSLQGQKWPHTNLTWSLQSLYIQNLDYYQVNDVLDKAINVWSKHSTLTFKNIHSRNADILIYFERQQHGDGYPFDGRGHVLAHAFFPNSGRGGDAHFDEEEQWSLDDEGSKGTSLFAVAAHEFGHSLGLLHSNVQGALMFPWYQGIKPNFDLPEDDRDAIQILYGPKPRTDWYYPPSTETTRRTPTRNTPRYVPPASPPPPYTPKVPKTRPSNPDRVPDTCDTSYDAISIIRGEVFIFKDMYVWRIGDKGMYKGYPNLIKMMWNQLPENFTHVDAVYERYDRKIVFFIGREVYMYNGNVLIHGFPKPLTALGLPPWLDHVDAAMVWGYNSKTYFFSGHLYWRFDEEVQHVELDYPRNMSIWKGIGYNIDAAFRWKDGATYFFKGKGFWKFNDEKLRVYDKRQSPSAQFWMGCPKALKDPNESDSIKEENNVHDVHVHVLEQTNVFTSYQYAILLFLIIIALILVTSLVVLIKRRNSHLYIRPKRIGIDR